MDGEALLLSASPSAKVPSPGISNPNTPSGLSVLLSKHEQLSKTPSDSSPSSVSTTKATPKGKVRTSKSPSDVSEDTTPTNGTPVASTSQLQPPSDQKAMKEVKPYRLSFDLESRPNLQPPSDLYTERSPLLRKSRSMSIPESSAKQPNSRESSQDRQYRPFVRWSTYFDRAKHRLMTSANASAESAWSMRKRSASELALTFVLEPVKTLPAVILGILMNLLDGVSYGMIMFPVSSPVFASFGGVGVSMVRPLVPPSRCNCLICG